MSRRQSPTRNKALSHPQELFNDATNGAGGCQRNHGSGKRRRLHNAAFNYFFRPGESADICEDNLSYGCDDDVNVSSRSFS